MSVSPRLRRALFWAPVALALGITLAWLLRPRPVGVDLAEVTRGPLQVAIRDEGRTRVKEVFVVSAPLPGFLHRIEVHAGDAVRAQETVVARVEPSDPSLLDARSAAEARAAVEAAEAARATGVAQLRRAQAEHEFAQSELARYRELAAQGVASESTLDAAERHARVASATLADASAGIAVRDADLERARARLLAPQARTASREACECVDVFSPVSGSVLRVVRESEGQIAAGEPILEVGDPAQLEIEVDLLSTDAVRVSPGQRVIVEAWGGEGSLEGVVRRVEPFGVTKVSALGIEEQRVNVLIDLADPRERWARLGHGFRVEPRIVLWESPDVLRVPFSALFRDGEAWAVFALDGGRADLRHVEIGHQNGIEAELLSGLELGERVVIHPSDALEAGLHLRERS